MGGLLESWKKDIEGRLEKAKKEGVEVEESITPVKRCPRCRNLSLEYDPENAKIKCTKCGFEHNIVR